MKYPTLLALLACASFVCAGQTPSGPSARPKCTLTRAQAPEIRGIRLGTSAEQLLALFPETGNRQRISDAVKLSKNPDKYGVGRLDLWPEQGTSNSRFAGVNFISVELLDERVSLLHIAYVGPEWNTVDQFTAKLSEALHLPSESWEGAGGTGQSLKCDGFVVDAYTSGGSAESVVRMRDTSVPQVVAGRRQVVKEKERQAFKP